MTPVVVATFLNLTEAQIAAGSLESGGMHPVVMDQGFGSVLWAEQFALQGFRLAVLGSEAAEAREFLSTLPARRVRRRNLRAREVLWRLATLPAWILGGAYLSWLVAGGIQRRRRGAMGELLALGAIVAAAGGLIIAGVIVLAVIFATALSRTAWPLLPLLAAIVIAVVASRRDRQGSD